MARVLVVDDVPAVLGIIELHLQRGGHTVVVARSAEDALASVGDNEALDVAVLDVAMPGMSGFDLLRALRAKKGLSSLPAVFVSARVEPDDVETGRSLGAVYLTKPFVAAALLTAIDRVVHDADTAFCATMETRMAQLDHCHGPLILSDQDVVILERLSSQPKTAPIVALRAQTVLAYANDTWPRKSR